MLQVKEALHRKSAGLLLSVSTKARLSHLISTLIYNREFPKSNLPGKCNDREERGKRLFFLLLVT